MNEALVGRQPIYDRRLELYGYELLFRREGDDIARFEDGDAATSQVILSAFHEIGIEAVAGRKRAFLNLTRGFIVGEYPLPVPTQNVVLEVLEHVEPDREVLRGIEALAERGYEIALDDFVLDQRTLPLLDLADFVKLDLDALKERDLVRTLDAAQARGIVTLVEQVRTAEEFESCRALGFDLYQGFFLSRPNVVRGKRVPASRVSVLRLLSRLMDPECENDELVHLVEQDVSLSYKLLRCINSASTGLVRPVETIRETVVYLGRDRIRSLAGLFVLAGLDDRPRDLLVSAMVRARMSELLAEARGCGDGPAYFTAGLFSTLPALLECTMQEVLKDIPLAEPIVKALLSAEGPLGEALGCVLAYECGDWERVGFDGLSSAEIRAAFLGAVGWAEDADRQLGQAA